MKIAFITSIVYPSPTANRIHILSMAKAFAKKGIEVDLLCRNISGVDFSSNIKKFELGTEKSITSAWHYASFLKKNKHEMWFIREPHLMFLTIIFFLLKSFKKPPFIPYEVHDLPRDFFDAASLRLLAWCMKYKIITITNLLKEDLVAQYNINPQHILVVPDGVDIELFEKVSKEDNHLVSQKDSQKPLVVYTGSLFPWKGVYTLVEVAARSPEIDFWIVGGYEKDIEMVKIASKGLNNVKVWGYVPHGEIVNFLHVADILALPNSATYRMSERYTSPLKLFEYMVSGIPIIASKLPSIQEILRDGENAYLVEPDSVEALKQGIEKIIASDAKENIVANAKKEVLKYTWDKRVERIIQAVS